MIRPNLHIELALTAINIAPSRLDAAGALLDALSVVLDGAELGEQVADLLELTSRKTAEVAAKIRARSAS